jgi:hypothetical protein
VFTAREKLVRGVASGIDRDDIPTYFRAHFKNAPLSSFPGLSEEGRQVLVASQKPAYEIVHDMTDEWKTFKVALAVSQTAEHRDGRVNVYDFIEGEGKFNENFEKLCKPRCLPINDRR